MGTPLLLADGSQKTKTGRPKLWRFTPCDLEDYYASLPESLILKYAAPLAAIKKCIDDGVSASWSREYVKLRLGELPDRDWRACFSGAVIALAEWFLKDLPACSIDAFSFAWPRARYGATQKRLVMMCCLTIAGPQTSPGKVTLNFKITSTAKRMTLRNICSSVSLHSSTGGAWTERGITHAGPLGSKLCVSFLGEDGGVKDLRRNTECISAGGLSNLKHQVVVVFKFLDTFVSEFQTLGRTLREAFDSFGKEALQNYGGSSTDNVGYRKSWSNDLIIGDYAIELDKENR